MFEVTSAATDGAFPNWAVEGSRKKASMRDQSTFSLQPQPSAFTTATDILDQSSAVLNVS